MASREIFSRQILGMVNIFLPSCTYVLPLIQAIFTCVDTYRYSEYGSTKIPVPVVLAPLAWMDEVGVDRLRAQMIPSSTILANNGYGNGKNRVSEPEPPQHRPAPKPQARNKVQGCESMPIYRLRIWIRKCFTIILSQKRNFLLNFSVKFNLNIFLITVLQF